ncbi:hypothetical protein [Actinophytocola sp.]|uniref:hypothetical protein n=1 Tax=Actinophytocola sp. TaxID=1872138 RepID=UPI002D80E685|nr:hypothetical protein [Actinophytocola sp.]HET9141727.1 hypothetical protein [Actinophytocola sp.]
MSEPFEKPTLEKWGDGEIRIDQIAYDNMLKQRVEGLGAWGKSWMKWLYDRDLSVEQSGINLVQKVVVDYSAAAILEKKIPQIKTVRSYWPIWTAYIYLKKPAEFHTLLFTGLDNGIRSIVKEYPRELEKSELQSDPFVGLGVNTSIPPNED